MRPKREISPGSPSAAPSASPSTGGDARTSAAGLVTDWRRRRLLRAGFGFREADAIAADPAYDLHSLIELVEGGCPPRLAIRILAPLERAAGS